MTTWETTTIKHGTPSGHNLHRSLGETPCTECTQARREYNQKRNKRPEVRRSLSLSGVAQSKAYAALARKYPTEYRQLREAYKQQLEAEGFQLTSNEAKS